MKKYRQRQNKRKTVKKEQENERSNSVWLCLISPKCTGSVNCAHADRITSNIYQVHFWFLEILHCKENAVF